ncbi:MAG TPA: hypothetical protein PLB91_10530 [Spirochaetales bacterium]|nr:hypothetical protein [Spirochaetales bacterium]HRZ64895.1 hypothetical protein [Spirochaetia bacterium]
MKTKYGLPLAILALALAALVGGCDIPDYQLDFSDIRVEEYNSPVAEVHYTIENYGSKDLSNVKILIEVMGADGTYTAWTPSYDISSGSSVTSSININVGTTYSLASDLTAYAVKAEWDGE